MAEVKPRLIAEIVGALLILSLISLAKCEGERVGRAEQQLSQAKREAKAFSDSADFLRKKLPTSEKQVAEKKQKLAAAKVVYRTVVDSVYVSVDDTAAVRGLIEAADKVIAEADSVIASQGAEILLLKSVVRYQDSQILSLNKQVKAALHSKPSRLNRTMGAVKYGLAGAVVGYGLAR